MTDAIGKITAAISKVVPDATTEWQVLKVIYVNLHAGAEINLLDEGGRVVKKIPGKNILAPTPDEDPSGQALMFYNRICSIAAELKLSETPLYVSVETDIGKAIKYFFDNCEVEAKAETK